MAVNGATSYNAHKTVACPNGKFECIQASLPLIPAEVTKGSVLEEFDFCDSFPSEEEPTF